MVPRVSTHAPYRERQRIPWPHAWPVPGFDPRFRKGSDTVTPRPMAQSICFDPRSREGSDPGACRITPGFHGFRSALPRGERPGQPVARAPVLLVSIRAPARGATAATAASDNSFLFRSALPRGERRQGRGVGAGRYGVSIRAPARGATCPMGQANAVRGFRSALPRGERPHRISVDAQILQVSIRAPARGATVHEPAKLGVHVSFDPRSREGSDAPCSKQAVSPCQVSIRAPARGATPARSTR